ncbi:MAG TPA: hypothetical protein VFM65_10840 [Flavobacteriaceae bacterium]|nr:hypothetical protein [Flavobacteriaceae bacterium]
MLIFLGKFLSVNSGLPQLLFDTEGITFVNLLCEKQNAQSSNKEMFSESTGSVITLSDVCNPVFQFEFPQWSKTVLIPNFQNPKHTTSSLVSIYGDKFYPPPKI